MSSTKVDRRIQRTRTQLHNAMRTLINEQEYDLITIQDIVDKAGLSRATFYLHFQDKSALLISIISTTIEEEFVGFQYNNFQSTLTSSEPTTMAFQLVERDYRLFKVVLSKDSTASLVPQIAAIIAKAMESAQRLAMSEEELAQLNVPIGLLCNFMAAGMLGSMAWWLEKDMPFSAEYMSDVTRRLNMFGAVPFLMGGAGPTEAAE